MSHDLCITSVFLKSNKCSMTSHPDCNEPDTSHWSAAQWAASQATQTEMSQTPHADKLDNEQQTKQYANQPPSTEWCNGARSIPWFHMLTSCTLAWMSATIRPKYKINKPPALPLVNGAYRKSARLAFLVLSIDDRLCVEQRVNQIGSWVQTQDFRTIQAQ